ncbi:MAG TPA: hypothetical protein VFK86_00060 [Bauldia sp.]|nr:hypothetical protein [Bauldia sp.]
MTIAQEQLSNADVALFFDSNYVNLSGPDSEAIGVQQALLLFGHVATTFVGTSTEAWRNATAGADVLVIPELQMAALPLSAGAMFFLREFVSDGGTLIVHGANTGTHDTDLLNALFDLALTKVDANTTSTPTTDVAGTTYAAGPPSLADNDDVVALDNLSLPAFARSFYKDALGDATVAGFQYGKGQVIWLGWDWYDALPLGSQDGGWNPTLNRSVCLSDFKPNGLVIVGTQSKDKVTVDQAVKGLDASDRDDVISLKKGNDKAWAGSGHDVISGDKGADKLQGDAGDDLINGGKDNDVLWGGPGEDYFLFDQKPGNSHADRIGDFVSGVDLILLKQSKFGGLTLGDMSAQQFSSLITYSDNGWLKYDGEKVAKLASGDLNIDNSDFLVVS